MNYPQSDFQNMFPTNEDFSLIYNVFCVFAMTITSDEEQLTAEFSLFV